MSDRAVLPSPEPTDARDVRWALETAQSLWGQGERREALQWVRRAAEAAAESGDDNRALSLAKMGAELRGVLEIPRTLPPPKVMQIPPPSERGDGELVVTVVSTDGSIPAPDASLVSHRALRVAVLPGEGNGNLLVRILAEGQVAPQEAKVALLVALEPGSSPLPVPLEQQAVWEPEEKWRNKGVLGAAWGGAPMNSLHRGGAARAAPMRKT